MKVEEAIVEQNIRKKGKSECFTWDFFKRYIVKNDGEDPRYIWAGHFLESIRACRSSSD